MIATLPATSGPEEACTFFVEWKTHVACPTNEPKGFNTSHWTSFGLFFAL